MRVEDIAVGMTLWLGPYDNRPDSDWAVGTVTCRPYPGSRGNDVLVGIHLTEVGEALGLKVGRDTILSLAHRKWQILEGRVWWVEVEA